MTEQRKYAILFAATLSCPRKIIEVIEPDKLRLNKQYPVDTLSLDFVGATRHF